MKKIVIASYTPFINDIDDVILKKYLENEGVIVDIISWDNFSYDWKSADCVIIRSVWDYHFITDKFIKWLNYLKENKIKVLNSVDVIINNILKNRQLKFLEEKDIPVINNRVFSKINKEALLPENTLQETLKKHFPNIYKKNMFVIKPTISARGKNTFIINLTENKNLKNEFKISEDAEAFFHEMINKKSKEGVIIEPFISDISRGEYSLIYLNKKLSHAILRYPGVLIKPKKEFILKKIPKVFKDLGKKIIKILPDDEVVYARIDMVYNGSTAQVMELELAEPDLYLRVIDGMGLEGENLPSNYIELIKEKKCNSKKMINFIKGIISKI